MRHSTCRQLSGAPLAATSSDGGGRPGAATKSENHIAQIGSDECRVAGCVWGVPVQLNVNPVIAALHIHGFSKVAGHRLAPRCRMIGSPHVSNIPATFLIVKVTSQ